MKKVHAEGGLKRIYGAKGGGGGGGSSESPDSLHSIARAKVLDVISEGPIVGLVNGLQSVYLDGTPIQNADGSLNFQNYTVDVRTGTQDQDHVPGFPAVEREAGVGVPLTSDAPWVRQIQNTQLTAVRVRFGVPALQRQDTSNGNITGYRVDYAIDLSVDGGSYAQVLAGAFDGKTTSLYERSHRIELPRAKNGWLIRVRRITPNAHTATIADAVNIEAITEIIDRKLRYPMTALVGMTFDARSFSSVPVRSYHVRGMIFRVPTNYDPETRTYSGTWDGTFKMAWTNNPAWVYYGLLLDKLYGLGDRVDASMVDKWALYAIARHCDELVSDGKGGKEPRFTCNCVIQTKADAFKVVQDIASVFRGISYWGAGSVVASADMPSDPVYLYTAANVVGGAFKYVGSERKTRYTVALVSYNDPTNQYKQAVEAVQDDDGIARYGVIKTEVTAFGCTSQAQAHRLGRWLLLTSRYETGTVSFQVGLDGTLCAPGQVIAVADPKRAGRRIGGRIRAVAGETITLDKAPTITAGDRFTAILPSGIAQARAVKSVDGDTVTLAQRFDADPVPGAVWMVESRELAAQQYRVVSVQESDDDGQIVYTINATQYEPGKYAAIDDGAQIQQRPITIVPPSVQPPPSNVRLSTYSVVDQGISKTTMVIAWDAASHATSYVAEWRKDNGEWVRAPSTGGLQVEVSGIYQGKYLARVRAENALGVTSIPAYGVDTVLTGKTTPPPSVVSLTATGIVFGIDLKWAFPGDGSAGDTQRTEIWYGRTPSRDDAIKFSDFAYPQVSTSYQGLALGQVFYFWARLVDTSGNVGPWFPAKGPGVQGQPSTDQSDYEKYFAGQIRRSALGTDLREPIDLITPPMAGDATIYAGDETLNAGVWSLQSAIAEGDMAVAKKVDTVAAQARSSSNLLNAAVQKETIARVEGERAMAQDITTVQAKVNDNVAAVQTVAKSYADLNGRVSASYQVKVQTTVDGRKYMAAIGVGIDNESGVVESQVLVSAKRFAVIDEDGAGVIGAPFVVQGGQVFLRQALIGAGWITNAMIGSYIQSDNYIAGRQGWRIDKSGWFEINSTDGQGNRTVVDSNGGRTYDANGVLRVRWGVWQQ